MHLVLRNLTEAQTLDPRVWFLRSHAIGGTWLFATVLRQPDGTRLRMQESATVPTGRGVTLKNSYAATRSRSRWRQDSPMPIAPFLDEVGSDPEARRIVGVAFEMARVALGLTNQTDLANESLARRIIELAKAGERNPDLLCEGVLKEFHEQRLQQQSK
jgi:hypothetical protein